MISRHYFVPIMTGVRVTKSAFAHLSIRTSQWRWIGRDGVSNYQPCECLPNHLFRRRWKKTSKLRVTGLYAGNSPVTGVFPKQMASNTENVSIGWRHQRYFEFCINNCQYVWKTFIFDRFRCHNHYYYHYYYDDDDNDCIIWACD